MIRESFTPRTRVRPSRSKPPDQVATSDPNTLQLTVTCTRDVPGADFVRNFEKAADMLMDLHEAVASKPSSKL